jgi:hypothetical protein
MSPASDDHDDESVLSEYTNGVPMNLLPPLVTLRNAGKAPHGSEVDSPTKDQNNAKVLESEYMNMMSPVVPRAPPVDFRPKGLVRASSSPHMASPARSGSGVLTFQLDLKQPSALAGENDSESSDEDVSVRTIEKKKKPTSNILRVARADSADAVERQRATSSPVLQRQRSQQAVRRQESLAESMQKLSEKKYFNVPPGKFGKSSFNTPKKQTASRLRGQSHDAYDSSGEISPLPSLFIPAIKHIDGSTEPQRVPKKRLYHNSHSTPDAGIIGALHADTVDLSFPPEQEADEPPVREKRKQFFTFDLFSDFILPSKNKQKSDQTKEAAAATPLRSEDEEFDRTKTAPFSPAGQQLSLAIDVATPSALYQDESFDGDEDAGEEAAVDTFTFTSPPPSFKITSPEVMHIPGPAVTPLDSRLTRALSAPQPVSVSASPPKRGVPFTPPRPSDIRRQKTLEYVKEHGLDHLRTQGDFSSPRPPRNARPAGMERQFMQARDDSPRSNRIDNSPDIRRHRSQDGGPSHNRREDIPSPFRPRSIKRTGSAATPTARVSLHTHVLKHADTTGGHSSTPKAPYRLQRASPYQSDATEHFDNDAARKNKDAYSML